MKLILTITATILSLVSSVSWAGRETHGFLPITTISCRPQNSNFTQVTFVLQLQNSFARYYFTRERFEAYECHGQKKITCTNPNSSRVLQLDKTNTEKMSALVMENGRWVRKLVCN